MTKAVTGLSIQLRTGVDYLSALSVSELAEIADTVNDYMEEVLKRGKK